jgi:hypothetical protein
MDQILKTDFFENIKKQAECVIKSDRNKYSYLYKIINKYCEDNDIIISNIKTILNIDDFDNIFNNVLNLYTDKPLTHCNNIINLLHEQLQNQQNKQEDTISETMKYETVGETKPMKCDIISETEQDETELIENPFYRTLCMKTNIENEEFSIVFNTRIIANVFKIYNYKSTKITDLISPVSINKLLYVPSEIEIIDVYHNIYLYEEQEKNIQLEKLLFGQIQERIDKNIIGGACPSSVKSLVASIKAHMIETLIKKMNNIIIIGSWVKNIVEDNICGNNEKIQIISDIEPNELYDLINNFLKNIKDVKLIRKNQDIHIPKDYRTTKITYYIKDKYDEKPFLDLFNCTTFELIPYQIYNNYKIAHKYVILRFLFIDLWIIKFIGFLKLLTDDIVKKKIKIIWSDIQFIKEFNYDEEKIKYIGTFKKYDIYKKLIKLEEKKYYPYFPEIYYKTNKTYRKL